MVSSTWRYSTNSSTQRCSSAVYTAVHRGKIVQFTLQYTDVQYYIVHIAVHRDIVGSYIVHTAVHGGTTLKYILQYTEVK